jgi:hypothetical protein
MSTNSKYFAVAVVILGVMAAATLVAFTENWNAGWELRPSLSLNKVHLVIRRSNSFGSSTNGRDVPLDNFRGFSLSMLATPGPAKFEYVADAGRLLCEGRFLLGTGSGTYTFAPDRGFVSAFRQMGYDTPDDEQLFSMLMMDIDRAFAREIRDTGMRASSRDLIQLRIHGVTLDYVREARQAGYQNFSAEDYAQLRIHGVTNEFLRELKSAGYDLRAGEIAQLSIHGVEPDFVRDARRLGYNFTPDELAQLRIHGVDAGYLMRLKDAGMRNLNAEQIAKLRVHGVD